MDFDARALRPAAAAAGVPLQEVIAVVEGALADAYQATANASPGVVVQVDVDRGSVTLTDADGHPVSAPDFGARATTAARQAIVSWMRNRERLAKVGHWADLEGSPITAVVKATGRDGEIRLDARGTAAVLPVGEAIAGENLRPGTEVTVLLLAANVTDRGAVRLTVSRRQPTLVTQLFERHLQRTRTGTTITGVAREPGVRSKVSCSGSIDPRSDLIGPAGTVVRAVMGELGGEKIDVVAHDPDIARYVVAALSPATVVRATLVDPARRLVRVEVSADQRPAAEGAGGLNVRLAMKLTGARIELQTV